MNKREIVVRLNEMFSNMDDMFYFCEAYANDPSKVIEMINKIIKFAFVYQKFETEELTIGMALDEMRRLEDLDAKYAEYLKKTNGLWQRLIKEPSKTFVYEVINEEIRLSDVKGLELPSFSKIEEICNINKDREEKRKQMEKKYEKNLGFSKVGFSYVRPELVTINNKMIYKGFGLTGNIERDLEVLYQDDRYGSMGVKEGPLYRGYEANIENMRNQNDITLRKYGNVNIIENGRHRLVYIMAYGNEETLAIKVIRRFEDKEINVILSELREKYGFSIYKNNLLNDEFDILLGYDNKVYNIKSKAELLKFYDEFKKDNSNISFSSIKFEEIELDYNDKEEIADRYTLIIYDLYLKYGESIITGNLTDLIERLNIEGDSILYDAYNAVQFRYQYSKVHNTDFNQYFTDVVNKIRNNNISIDDDINEKTKKVK